MKTINSRERLVATLNHRQPDRVCVDFGGTWISGIHTSIVHKLKQRLIGQDAAPRALPDAGRGGRRASRGSRRGRHRRLAAAALAAGTHLTKGDHVAAVTKAVEAAIVRTPDADFTAARDTVETRIKGFTEAGLELPEELLAACWVPEAEFKKSQKTLTSIPAFKVRAGPTTAEPFATPPNDGAESATMPIKEIQVTRTSERL